MSTTIAGGSERSRRGAVLVKIRRRREYDKRIRQIERRPPEMPQDSFGQMSIFMGSEVFQQDNRVCRRIEKIRNRRVWLENNSSNIVYYRQSYALQRTHKHTHTQ